MQLLSASEQPRIRGIASVTLLCQSCMPQEIESRNLIGQQLTSHISYKLRKDLRKDYPSPEAPPTQPDEVIGTPLSFEYAARCMYERSAEREKEVD